MFSFGLIFMTGIISDALFSIPSSIILGVVAILAVAFLALEFQIKKTKRRQYALLGLLFVFTIFVTGVFSNSLRSSLKKKIDDPSGDLLLIELKEEVNTKRGQKNFKALFRSWNGDEWSETRWSYIYVSQVKSITIGSVIFTLNRLKGIVKKSNPGEFDFFQYAVLNDIHHTMYINKESDFILLRGAERENSFSLDKIRNHLINIIRKHFPDNHEAGLAEAILLGYRKNLDQELIQNYLDTGVIHVIAISGMHLGLIFSLVNWLVQLTIGKKRSKWAAFLLSLPLLWGFALLTGGSASVLRSAIMFSFSIIAALIDRRNQPINGLGGGLLILLLYDPDAWLDLGFQLSFAAVLSIMLYNKVILSWLQCRNPLLKQAWNLVAITLAAQILTTPIVIFHFHRFPTLFLFTNIIAVPLSSILLLLEITMCVLDPFDITNFILDPLAQVCMNAMNGYIGQMARVPFGMINDIHISFATMLSTMILLMCIWKIWRRPTKSLWKWWIFSILLYSFVTVAEKYKLQNKREIWILSINRKNLILHRHGNKSILYLPMTSKKDGGDLERIHQICQSLGIRDITWKELPDQLLLLEEKEIFMLINTSTEMWKSREWQKALQKLHLRFHPSRDEGPLTIRCSHSNQKS